MLARPTGHRGRAKGAQPMRWILVAAMLVAASVQAQKTEKAIFAAGCFWCTEEAFEKVPGVTSAVSGYTGGTVKNPSYEQVSSGRTGHAEAVEVTFDPAKVTYEQLLDVFWVNHDPTVKHRQFCDSGSQYRPAIFYINDEQKSLAQASKAQWDKVKPFKQPILTEITNAHTGNPYTQPILTEITRAGPFYPAEDYNQNYYKKTSLQYRFYVPGCGR